MSLLTLKQHVKQLLQLVWLQWTVNTSEWRCLNIKLLYICERLLTCWSVPLLCVALCCSISFLCLFMSLSLSVQGSQVLLEYQVCVSEYIVINSQHTPRVCSLMFLSVSFCLSFLYVAVPFGCVYGSNSFPSCDVEVRSTTTFKICLCISTQAVTVAAQRLFAVFEIARCDRGWLISW